MQPRQIYVGDYQIEYDTRFEHPNFGIFDQSIRVSGTNTIALSGKLNGMSVLSMATGTPTPEARTRGWIGDRDAEEPRATTPSASNDFQSGEAFFQRLIDEDTPIMSTIRFREGLLIDADRALATFLQYVKRFPTARPAARFA